MQIISSNLSFKSVSADRRSTSLIVVHHTADPNDPSVGEDDKTVEDVHRGHLYRGFWGIGYNLLQADDGKWYEGRGIDKQGAHATGFNRTSIGICLTGNFEINSLPEYRRESLVEMCVFLCKKYSHLEYTSIIGHRELPGAATLCPGRFIDLSKLRKDVKSSVSSPVPDIDLYRVLEEGIQVGAYENPMKAVEQAVSRRVRSISLELAE